MNKDYGENGYLESRTVEDMFRNPYNTWGGEQIELLAREVLCRRKQWISVKDRLPGYGSKNILVLCWDTNSRQWHTHFLFDNFLNDKAIEVGAVHYWAQLSALPEPPESEE